MAYMHVGEVLFYDRSSNLAKRPGLDQLCGVIDGDYYGNPGNEGHIFPDEKYYRPGSRP